MTVGAWVVFGTITLLIVIILAVFVIGDAVNPTVAIIVGFVLIMLLYVGCSWWCNNTAAGQRAWKSQQSNFNGGLYRTVTVYGYSGNEIKSWTGKFDVTENDQETWFDIDGKRVIIQGGIIINEEQEVKD